MKHLFVTSLLLAALQLLSGCSSAPATANLHAQLHALAQALPGEVGIYVRHLETGEQVCIAAGTLFPTASMIKVPILGALLDKVEQGELDYHQELTYTLDRLYAGEDLLGSFQDKQAVTLDKVAMLMITTSDNTAALWCQELAGKGTVINHWLAKHGFEQTRVNSRTDGREDNWKRYGWGQTTPREMAELLVAVRNRELVSVAASEEMQRCLSRIHLDATALSAMPPAVQTMSKQGAVSHSRSEAVLVHAPHGDYVFCVITKDQEDKSWGPDNQGYVLLREISALLWQHFEPNWPYAAPAGADKFQ